MSLYHQYRALDSPIPRGSLANVHSLFTVPVPIFLFFSFRLLTWRYDLVKYILVTA